MMASVRRRRINFQLTALSCGDTVVHMTNPEEAVPQTKASEDDYQLKPGYWETRPRTDEEKDWKYEKQKDWIKGYIQSVDHPHRALIIEALVKLAPFESVLEVGSNCGPNLFLVHKNFPDAKLAGIDLNAEAIEEGKKLVPDADLRTGSMAELPWGDKSFDVCLSDAALLYVSPETIDHVMAELDRITKKAIVLVERFDSSPSGAVRGHVWGRDYPVLLERLGFAVEQTKLDENTWPGSFNWQKFGYLFVGVRK